MFGGSLKPNRVVVLGLIAVGAVIALGASVGVGAASTHKSKLCPHGKIIVGFAKAKTGFFALNDQADAHGAELAIRAINSSGGVHGCKLVVKSGDTKSDAAVAGQVAQQLLGSGAKILVTPADFDLGIAAAQAAEKAGVVGIAPSASADAFAPAVGPHFFVGGVSPTTIGKAVAKFAISHGWKKAFDLTDQSFDYFTSQDKVFRKAFAARGGTIVGSDLSTSGQQDFSSTVTKIATSKASFVYGNDFYPQVAGFIKQLRTSGIKLPVMGNSAYAFQGLPGAIGSGNTSKVYYVSPVYYEGKGVSSGVRHFIKVYKKAFGHFPESVNCFSAFDSMTALLRAVRKADSLNAAKVSAAMRAERNLKVGGSTLVRWTNGHAVYSATVIGLTAGGAFKPLVTYKAVG